MTGTTLDLATVEPIEPAAWAEGLARRDEAFRVRMVQMMILLALLLRPLPPAVAERLQAFADELGVGDDCRELLGATRQLASGALGLAMADFERNGYETMAFERVGDGADHTAAEYWAANPNGAALAARWASVEHCPDGSLGRKIWEFYRARGFCFRARRAAPRRRWPSTTGSTSWPTTARPSSPSGLRPDPPGHRRPRAFSLLAQILGLFEAGYLQAGWGCSRRTSGTCRPTRSTRPRGGGQLTLHRASPPAP